MKNNEKEKQFEVIISPTDIMTNELEEILGGATCSEVNACWENEFDCKYNFCKTNIGPCPPGYVRDSSGECVPIPEGR